ncbi:hypothetical protein [Cohaesibacter celericrescens]|nr:hypothetical protein [Cohaesibacter celericrescens]
MTITSAHREHGPGHAWLDIGQDASPQMRVVVEREADKDRYLGLDCWQSTPLELAVEDASDNRLLLGPNVVDHLKEGDFIKITVPQLAAMVEDFWPNVPISGRRGVGSGLVSSQPKKKNKGRDNSDAIRKNAAAFSAGLETENEEAPLENFGVGEDTRLSKWKLFAVVAGMCLLWIGAGVFAWLYYDELSALWGEEQSVVAEAQQQLPSQTSTAPVRDRAYWQSMLVNEELSGDQLYEAAHETSSQPDLLDISDDFLRLSAGKDHALAMREYAEIFDPTKEIATRQDAIKNPRTALQYYTQLSANGDNSVSTEIDDLCQLLKPKYYEDAEARTTFDDYCS